MSSSNGTTAVSSNGQHPAAGDALTATDVIAMLRTPPQMKLLFKGFGTLVAGAVLFVLMLVIAPSVAPEHVVDKPVSTSPTPSAPVTTAPPTTAPAPPVTAAP